MIPRIFKLLQVDNFEDATRLSRQSNPDREGTAAASAYMAQTGVIHLMQWKYMGWLNGFNGGPMRRPSMRINDAMMKMQRDALVKSGIEITASHDREFFIEHHPTEVAERPSQVTAEYPNHRNVGTRL